MCGGLVYVECGSWPATESPAINQSRHPLLDDIAKKFISYIQRCLSSDSDVVKFVTSYGIVVGRMTSPTGSSAWSCSTKCGFILRDIRVVSTQICLQNFFVDWIQAL